MRAIAFATTTILLLVGCSSATTITTTTTTEPEPAPTAEVTTTTAATGTTVGDTTTTTVVDVTTTTAPEAVQITIAYENGAVSGGGRIEVPLGEPVLMTIVSDVADEGHLHGYDIFVDLEPGTEGVIEFLADIPGIFELELESSGVLLADLEIAP